MGLANQQLKINHGLRPIKATWRNGARHATAATAEEEEDEDDDEDEDEDDDEDGDRQVQQVPAVPQTHDSNVPTSECRNM